MAAKALARGAKRLLWEDSAWPAQSVSVTSVRRTTPAALLRDREGCNRAQARSSAIEGTTSGVRVGRTRREAAHPRVDTAITTYISR